MGKKEPIKTDEKQLEILAGLRPIDDGFFEIMMEDADTCEELLQVFLENPLLRVKKDSVVGQKSIRIIGKRSVRVDAYAEGNEGEVFNIEVQKADNDNHVKRVRYNASVITVNKSEPGEKFESVKEVYVIYVSDFDVLKNGLTVSHAEMTCLETGEKLDDGLHEVYINTTGGGDSKIARLMKEFLNPDMNNPEFPCTSKRVQAMKHDEREVKIVCKAIEDYANMKAEEAAREATERAEKKAKKAEKETQIRTTVEELTNLDIPVERIAERLREKFSLTDEEISTYLSK